MRCIAAAAVVRAAAVTLLTAVSIAVTSAAAAVGIVSAISSSSSMWCRCFSVKQRKLHYASVNELLAVVNIRVQRKQKSPIC
jgi:hypothetical protein